MKKKIMSLLLVVFTLALLLPQAAAPAAAESSGDYGYWLLDDGTVYIESYSGKEVDLVIPEKIDGHTVTHIGIEAFADNKYMKSVTVPDSVVYIGHMAFASCKKLNKITLGNGIKSIGLRILLNTKFYDNAANWSDGVLYVGQYLVDGQHIGMEEQVPDFGASGDYKVKDGTSVIADGAFLSTDITSVTFPETLKVIGMFSFENCEKLNNIKLPDSIEHLGLECFYGTGYYNNGANWSNGVLYAGKYLLTAAQIGDNITDVTDNHLVSGKYTVKSGTRLIAEAAFIACERLTNISFPSSLKIINDMAFMNCTSLKGVIIPETVTRIDEGAFGYYFDFEDVDKKVPSFTIVGKKGTAASKYASDNKFKFYDYGKVPTSIVPAKKSLTLGVGETYSMTVTTSPANIPMTSWTTSDKTVATVSGSGRITAKKAGTVTITAKSLNGKSASIKVTVKKAPTTIKLNKTAVTLGVGETYKLSSTVSSGSASAKRSYTTSSKSVVTVASDGTIKAKKTGTATIKVKTYNGKTATCKVTVKAAPKSVKLNRTSIVLKVGQSYKLSSIVNSGSASLKRTYTSSNTAVATVSGGKVTAKKAGTATIKVRTYNGKTATCKVTVKK